MTNAPDTSDDRPLVTFALFAYNQEKYIREAVKGAFSQTYEPLEIILSDDCSSDRTFEIMQEMAAVYDGPHVVSVRRNSENSGTLCHIKNAVAESRGSFIVLAAGDDVSRARRVEMLYESWRSQGSWAVFSDFADIDHNGNLNKEHCQFETIGGKRHGLISFMKGNIKEHNIVHGATSAYDRRVFEYIVLRKDSYILGEDGALSLLIHILGKTVSYVGEPLVEYRKHNDSLTNSARQRLSWTELDKAEHKIAMYARSNLDRWVFILDSHRRLNQDTVARIDTQLIEEEIKNNWLMANWWNMDVLQKLEKLSRTQPVIFKWALPRLLPRKLFLTFKYIIGHVSPKKAK